LVFFSYLYGTKPILNNFLHFKIMKKILIPTDFSKNAEYALKVAAQIAKKHQGEIILLHMLELPGQAGDAVNTGHDIPEIMFFKNAVVNRILGLKEEPYLDGIKVTELVKLEMTFDGIINVSKENNVDLIVMGSHGASGFKEMFIGSNAEKVVRSSDIPVLIIKNDIPDFNVNKFVFASDFSEEIKEPFKKVVALANKFGAELNLVMINTPNSFKSTLVAESIMNDFLHSFEIDNFKTHIFNDANIEKGILNFAKYINADLIGMCTHGRKGLSHFFNGSISEDLVNHAIRPVVTFKI